MKAVERRCHKILKKEPSKRDYRRSSSITMDDAATTPADVSPKDDNSIEDTGVLECLEWYRIDCVQVPQDALQNSNVQWYCHRCQS